MTEKQATWLGWLTLAALLAALWVVFGEDPGRNQAGRGEALYPGLDAEIAALEGIALSAGDTATTLSLEGGVWAVADRSGYRAEAGKVAALVRGLVRSTRREPKTTRTARFPDLGLGEDALTVTLMGTGSTPLVPALDIGTRNEGANGRSLTYVFKHGDTRAWLVSDLADVSADPADWIDAQVKLMDESLIAEIRYSDVTLVRDDTGTFVVEGLAEGESLASEFLRRDPARLMAGFRADDVRRLANPLVGPEATVAAVSADGLSVTFTLFTIDGTSWLQVAASGDGAEAITEETDGWMYQLSVSDASILRRDRSAFVQAALPPAPEAPSEAPSETPSGS